MKEGEQGPRTETISLTVPSHPKFLYVVRSAVYPVLTGAGFSKGETRKIILALDEACSNVIRHAYRGDPSHAISLTVTIESGELRLVVKDTGERAEASKIAPRDLEDVRPGGLGTHFMQSVFDSVRYDTSGPRGTVLTMIKKRRDAAEVH